MSFLPLSSGIEPNIFPMRSAPACFQEGGDGLAFLTEKTLPRFRAYGSVEGIQKKKRLRESHISNLITILTASLMSIFWVVAVGDGGVGGFAGK